ncbi:MAG: Rab family GTPase, partial [Candidatus Thermoplasmatota archaeon]
LIRRFVFDMFDDSYITTIGAKVTRKQIRIGETFLTLMLWDILGQKLHPTLPKQYQKGAEGGLIVADGTRKETIASLDSWGNSLIETVGRVPIIFIINKKDLIDMNSFSTDEIERLSKKHLAPYIFTSAKTGENVEEAFLTLGKLIVDRLV